MALISFTALVSKIDTKTLIVLPSAISAKLPSRGMVMVQGTLNGHTFKAALEPDGKSSHWLLVDNDLHKAAKVEAGDHVKLAIEPMKDWPEPIVPADLRAALNANQTANAMWQDITPMARWDWIRWINGTKQAATRQRRIDVALSKMNAGSRRPCCFNRSMCTDPYISKNGVLLGLE